MPVTSGLENLLRSDRLAGLRVGVVANPASVGRTLAHAVDLVAHARDVTVGAIFGPQHGLHAAVQDNMIETPHARDPVRNVPVHSLYSETREPTPAMLEGLDALVIDLQDVGTRVYTYAYTMANCLRAAARSSLPVLVCDRPNPIGGVAVEGPVIQPGFESFVGQFAIPLRHGLTIGELGRLFNDHFGIGASLEVIPMTGWSRSMYYDETGLPWVMPSPNIPTLDSAIVYPGTVLFEGTLVSEGRGTTRPFELVGAPWVDPHRLVERLSACDLAGVRFRPIRFEPTFHKHVGQTCGGCQLHVTDRRAFRPVLTAVSLLRELRRADPDRFAWRPPPYEYETHKLPIDVLWGSGELRLAIEQDRDPGELAANWERQAQDFLPVRAECLLY